MLAVNEPHLQKNGRPRCNAKSPTLQDVFQPIPGLISCAGVTRTKWSQVACLIPPVGRGSSKVVRYHFSTFTANTVPKAQKKLQKDKALNRSSKTKHVCMRLSLECLWRSLPLLQSKKPCRSHPACGKAGLQIYVHKSILKNGTISQNGLNKFTSSDVNLQCRYIIVLYLAYTCSVDTSKYSCTHELYMTPPLMEVQIFIRRWGSHAIYSAWIFDLSTKQVQLCTILSKYS